MAGEAKLRCRRARELASEHLDGELSALEALRLERHLAGCPECRAWRDGAEVTTRLLRTAPLERPSRPVPGPPPRRRARGRAALAIAAVVAAALVSSVLGVALRGGDSHPARPPAPVLGLLPDNMRQPALRAPLPRPEPRPPDVDAV
jgi:anti-sigma factor RsiW